MSRYLPTACTGCTRRRSGKPRGSRIFACSKLVARRDPIPDCDSETSLFRPPAPRTFSPDGPGSFPPRGGAMKPLIIGVAGGSGSGKSTVARNVAQALHGETVAFIDMDAYYLNFAHLPLPERRKINWDHPESFDWELLVGQLASLAAGEP